MRSQPSNTRPEALVPRRHASVSPSSMPAARAENRPTRSRTPSPLTSRKAVAPFTPAPPGPNAKLVESTLATSKRADPRSATGTILPGTTRLDGSPGRTSSSERSQRSPTALSLTSPWSALDRAGQLSKGSATPSPSVSGAPIKTSSRRFAWHVPSREHVSSAEQSASEAHDAPERKRSRTAARRLGDA
jgi:hypothetical protein